MTYSPGMRALPLSLEHDASLCLACTTIQKVCPGTSDSWTDDFIIIYSNSKERLCDNFGWNFHPFLFLKNQIKMVSVFLEMVPLKKCKFIPSFCILRITCST